MPIKITINHGDGWSETWEVDDNNELFVEDHKRNYRTPCGRRVLRDTSCP